MHVMAELVGSRAVVLPGHFPSLKKKRGRGGGLLFCFSLFGGSPTFFDVGAERVQKFILRSGKEKVYLRHHIQVKHLQ